MTTQILMMGGAAGRWSGDSTFRSTNNADQQVSKRGEVVQSHGDPSSYNFFVIDRSVKQVAGSWSGSRKSESSEITMWVDMKTSIAKYFRNMIWIDYRWLLRSIRHRMPPFSKGKEAP